MGARRRLPVLSAFVAAVLLGGCATGTSSEPPGVAGGGPVGTPTARAPGVAGQGAIEAMTLLVAEESAAAGAPPPRTRCEPASRRSLRTPRQAYAAVAARRLAAWDAPGGRKLATFAVENVNGFPTVFGVLAVRVDRRCQPTWYHVQLPMRPNGSTGWVEAGAVTLVPVRTRVLVDLSDRRVLLFEAGRRVLSAHAAIGSEITPTPTGSYYVNQRLLAADPSGPYGYGGIGISAFSPVLTSWAQGGPIAIHGTNDPTTIGRSISSGCIRVDAATLRRLFELVPAGTPVVIRA